MPATPIRIVDKPWGREIVYANNERYIGKIIEIHAGQRLSLQFHREKDESVYVLEGTLALVIGPSKDALETVELGAGAAYRIRPGEVHRFHAPHGPVRVLEVSTPHFDDVVRVSDDYGRAP